MENYVTLICKRCGEEYDRHVSNADGSKWCSLECQQGTFSGEQIVEHGDKDWYEIRRRALERDDYECQNCGAGVGRQSETSTADAHVHH